MKKKMSLLAVLLMAVAVTAYSVSGTYAKYTSSATASDSARVAKWDIDFNTLDTDDHTFTFNLFETVLDSDGVSTETHIGASDIIAPGTSGEFTMSLQNKSEVYANYSIDYTVTNTNNIPVLFSVNGGDTWTSDLADVADTPLDNQNATEITVQWKWAFEDTSSDDAKAARDASDTTLGAAGTAELKVEAKVTATQID